MSTLRRLAAVAALGAAVLMLAIVASAWGADSVYWTASAAQAGTGSLRVGNLDGNGTASSLFTGETFPQGVAIDPAAGTIYWAADNPASAIRVGSLAGGAASTLFPGENRPYGVAIDPTAGKLYWADFGSGTIRVGNLDGTGAHDLFTGESGPTGVAIDPAAGKIYWADANSGMIRTGSLSGGTATDLFIGESTPWGVAIDPAAGKIYWASVNAIRVGSLAGGTASSLFAGEVHEPLGVAVDPGSGLIYWTTSGSTGAVRVGSLSGGAATDLFPGNGPAFLALLRSPAGTGAPQITGGTVVGSTLSCSPGSWAPDLLDSFLYRAPRGFAYQWSLDGADIPGATASSDTASSPGSYTCRVTATNQAGSTVQASASLTVMAPPPPNTRITKAKISQRQRKAMFKFKAIGSATGFQCKLKRAHRKKPKARFRSCHSPKTYKHMKPGKYTFKVRAVGRGGTDPTPAKRKFKIKR
jgi:DNA-binding beta-propeller fold protein YncE